MIVLILAQGVGLSLAMMLAWWCQRRWNNAGWVDVFWTFATGATAVLGSVWPIAGFEAFGPRQMIVVILAAFWSGRLGSHLRRRVLTRPEDARYAGFRREWGDKFQRRLFGLLQIQAAAAWPLAVAVMVAARNPAPDFSAIHLAALAVMGAAITGEAMSDRRLSRFVADPRNKGRICDTGLWAWSRHPNYFFEFLFWCGWPLFAFDLNWPFGWLAVFAPVLMYWLLVHVSGIPPLEQVMLASRGDAFRVYQNRTSRFFPLPPRPEANV
jgi:steroid 5-alpha reductase family enzyme